MPVRSLPNSFIRRGTTSVRFQGVPNDFSEQKSATWNSTDIIGRSEPIRSYSSSTPRTVSLNLDFHASLDQGDGGTAGELENKILFFRSLVYPEYGAGSIKPPETVLFKFGTWFAMRAVAVDVNVSYPGPYEIPTLRPLFAQVAISLEERNVIPLSRSDIIEKEVVESLGEIFSDSVEGFRLSISR